MKLPQSFSALLFIARLVALSDCRRTPDSPVVKRVTVPAPISVAAAQNWDGNDGSWSSFAFQLGTPAQIVRLFVSTALHQVSVVVPEGCVATDPSDCANLRGGLFFRNESSTFQKNMADPSTTIYPLALGENTELGYTGKGTFGFDDITVGWQGAGGPMLKNQTVGGIAAKDTYLGLFGLTPRASNFTSFNDPIPSFLQNMRSQSLIPSLAWGYTAGNQYRLNQVLGSLTLGGYDSSRFVAHDMTWGFNGQDIRDLTVQITAITSSNSSGKVSLLSRATPAFLDSGLPYIWLPEESCILFEQAFNLTYNETTNLYPVNDAQHKALLAHNPNITFTLGNLTAGVSTDISLPYAAFDLVASFPIFPVKTKYFPLRRAANATQVTLGRTFFQEAYVIADYDRGNFSVSQCKWEANAQQAIVPILAPSLMAEVSASGPGVNGTTAGESKSKSKSKSTPVGAIAGGVVGGIVALAAAAYLLYRFCIKPRRHAAEAATAAALAATAEKNETPAPTGDTVFKPELAAEPATPANEVDGGKNQWHSEVDGGKNQWHSEVDGGKNQWHSEVDGGKNQWHAEADGTPVQIYEMPAEEVASELRGEGGVPEVLGSTSHQPANHPARQFSYMQTPIEMSRNPNARWSWLTSPGGDTLREESVGSPSTTLGSSTLGQNSTLGQPSTMGSPQSMRSTLGQPSTMGSPQSMRSAPTVSPRSAEATISPQSARTRSPNGQGIVSPQSETEPSTRNRF